MVELKDCNINRTSADYFFKDLPISDALKKQINEITTHPACCEEFSVKVMPDAHAGVGACVGSVIPLDAAIVPSFVGDDIGCGMTAIRLDIKKKDLPDSLSSLRSQIERMIPMGRSNRGMEGDIGKWDRASTDKSIAEIFTNVEFVWQTKFASKWNELCKDYQKLNGVDGAANLATLGTGNHFIEITYDEQENIWLLAHSGSRGVGAKVASVFNHLARVYANRSKIDKFIDASKHAFLILGTPEFSGYMKAQKLCLDFADTSRQLMLDIVKTLIQKSVDKIISTEDVISISHNYIECHNTQNRSKHAKRQIYVTRKGAIKLLKDQRAIIPGSMGRCTYIVKGTGHDESYSSCSHGAGRVLSRSMAKKSISLEKHIADLADVECDKSDAVIDETPEAYKDIDHVINVQREYGMLEVVSKLKPLLCCKGLDIDYNK